MSPSATCELEASLAYIRPHLKKQTKSLNKTEDKIAIENEICPELTDLLSRPCCLHQLCPLQLGDLSSLSLRGDLASC